MQILSEFSSDQTEEDRTKSGNQTLPFSAPPEEAFNYIDRMFQDPNETDLRYLTLYNKIDMKRKKRWEQIDRAKLEEANLKYLKFLIG